MLRFYHTRSAIRPIKTGVALCQKMKVGRPLCSRCPNRVKLSLCKRWRHMTQPHAPVTLPSDTHSIEALSGSGYFEDKKALFTVQHSGSQTMNTVAARVYVSLYTYIRVWFAHAYCVCISDKVPLSDPQNQHFNYVSCSIILHKTPCIYIFWEWASRHRSINASVTATCSWPKAPDTCQST